MLPPKKNKLSIFEWSAAFLFAVVILFLSVRAVFTSQVKPYPTHALDAEQRRDKFLKTMVVQGILSNVGAEKKFYGKSGMPQGLMITFENSNTADFLFAELRKLGFVYNGNKTDILLLCKEYETIKISSNPQNEKQLIMFWWYPSSCSY